jgi:polyisoprenoid-binding protein YceI
MFIVKFIAFTLLLVFGNFSTTQEVQEEKTGSFAVDPVHSTAIFRAHHLGAGMFYGRFNDVTGTIEMTNDLPSFSVSIAIESVDTNSAKLDGHLKSPDFFNSVEFPAMTFKSATAKKVGDEKYEVAGEITLHGVTRPFTVVMSKTGQVVNNRGEMIGFETEFELKRSDFGMSYGVESGALSDKIKVIVALEAGRK